MNSKELSAIILMGFALLVTSGVTYNLGYQEAQKNCKPLIITDIPIFPEVSNYE